MTPGTVDAFVSKLCLAAGLLVLALWVEVVNL